MSKGYLLSIKKGLIWDKLWTDTEEEAGLCCGIRKEVEVQAPGLAKYMGRK